MHRNTGDHRVQKKAWDPLELECKEVTRLIIGMLGIELKSSAE